MVPVASNRFSSQRVALLSCGSRRKTVVALGRHRDFATESIEHAVQALNKYLVDHQQKRERQRRSRHDEATSNGAAEVDALPVGRPITFKASAKAEKLVKEPPGAGPTMRGLSAYLALPLDQYSLLDPGWISRSPAAPDEFVLRVPLFELVGLDMQPQLSVKVSLDPRTSQVHFLADKFKVGDPRFDEDFKLHMRASLRNKPVPTLRPLRSIRRMWSKASGREEAAASAAATTAAAANGGSNPGEQQATPGTVVVVPPSSLSPTVPSSSASGPPSPSQRSNELQYSSPNGSGTTSGNLVQRNAEVVIAEVVDGTDGAVMARFGDGNGAEVEGAQRLAGTASLTSSSSDTASFGANTAQTGFSSSNADANGFSCSSRKNNSGNGNEDGNHGRFVVDSNGYYGSYGSSSSSGGGIGPRGTVAIRSGLPNGREGSLAADRAAVAASAAHGSVPTASASPRVAVEQLPFIEESVLYVPASQWGRSECGDSAGTTSATAGSSGASHVVAAAAASRNSGGGLPSSSASAAATVTAPSASCSSSASGSFSYEPQCNNNGADVTTFSDPPGMHASFAAHSPTSTSSAYYNGQPQQQLGEANAQMDVSSSNTSSGASNTSSSSSSNNSSSSNGVGSSTTTSITSSSNSSNSDEGATALLVGSVDLSVTVTVPSALTAVPRPLLGMTGSLIVRYAISSLLPSFLDLLVADYGRWSSGQTVAARAAPAGDLAAAAAANAAANGGTVQGKAQQAAAGKDAR
ncbi:hypothetical protein Agub_g9789 [Astrephomene gubernaculifera]|uniref:Uncharacterized protein n=1 Tax=Astrephomene gubernaculifera TaxID=47775 RepID=A0AAD3DWR2_9CHLO|nr:hypothetical protein Agub_g9789 [Astrephomene gubernaculifera]